MSARAVVVLAKVPEAGRSKTRLAPAIGAEAAAALAGAMLADTFAALERLNPEVIRVFAASGDLARARALAPPTWRVVPQADGDLGARLAAAWRAASAERVALVGADAPAMTAARVTAALDALDAAELTVGPTEDGGYDVIAMARVEVAVLDDMPWSTPQLLPETEARAARAGLRLVRLGPGFDVDTPDDLAALLARLDAERVPAPATRAWLSAHARATFAAP